MTSAIILMILINDICLQVQAFLSKINKTYETEIFIIY